MNNKDISIERRKEDIIHEILSCSYRNLLHRAFQLRDNDDLVLKIQELGKEFSYLIDLQNNKIKKE